MIHSKTIADSVNNASRREITVPFNNQTISYNSWIAVGAVTIVLLFEARRKLIVDHIVHRGGFIAGVATGWILQKPKSESSRVQELNGNSISKTTNNT